MDIQNAACTMVSRLPFLKTIALVSNLGSHIFSRFRFDKMEVEDIKEFYEVENDHLIKQTEDQVCFFIYNSWG